MEHIINNELYEEIKIREGLVLKIKKYNLLSYENFKSKDLKGNVLKVGSKLYKLKKDITRKEWGKGEVVYPKDTYIMNQLPVKKSFIENYIYEITSAGGSISGDRKEVLRDLDKIIEQIKQGLD